MDGAPARVVFAKFISFIRKTIRPKSFRAKTQTTSVPNSPLDNECASFHPSLQISMRKIFAATKNFSEKQVVGYSGYGLVYKAELSNGLKLAVRKLDPGAFQDFMELRWEMEILAKLRHPNIARILGYCASGADKILIYEFNEKGNVAAHLHYLSSSSVNNKNKKSYGKSPLSWEARHKIVTGVAEGLAYIHDLDKPIIHRDVKASNVLLNAEMEAKISDFGLARRIESEGSQVSSQAVGTEGYMPPEYEEGSRVATVKGDVYSFGVLMLEAATGKKPFLSVDLNGESMSFLEWARVMVAQNRVRGMLDANIWVCDSQRGLEEDNIKEYFRIAFMCVDMIPKKRPAMRDVVELLTRNFI